MNEPKAAGQEKTSSEDSVSEKYYTVEELAAMWKVSPRMIERAFKGQPGVIQAENVESGESASSLRIPHSVMKLVYERSDPLIMDENS